jgi:hypothetical protein
MRNWQIHKKKTVDLKTQMSSIKGNETLKHREKNAPSNAGRNILRPYNNNRYNNMEKDKEE